MEYGFDILSTQTFRPVRIAGLASPSGTGRKSLTEVYSSLEPRAMTVDYVTNESTEIGFPTNLVPASRWGVKASFIRTLGT